MAKFRRPDLIIVIAAYANDSASSGVKAERAARETIAFLPNETHHVSRNLDQGRQDMSRNRRASGCNSISLVTHSEGRRGL